jgi:CHASE2 domain-containing sensor protein
MKLFKVQDELIWLAVLSVFVSIILTNLMWIRSMGIAGIGGLSIVYFRLGSSSLPGTILTGLTALLVIIAISLAIYSDLSFPLKNNQGDEKSHEI